MKYHQFTPEPEALAARILAQQPSAQSVQPASAVTSAGSPPPPPNDIPATVDALTALRDSEFVQAAYRVLLGRDADASGLASFVQQLRSGALDKVEILGDLRHSPEGEARAVEIAGLDWRYTLRRIGRRRRIGWLLRWALAVLRLPDAVRAAQRQQAVGEEHAAAIQQIGRDIRDLRAHARMLATRTQTAESALGDLFGSARVTEHKMAELQARLVAAQEAFEVRHQHLSAANARLVQQLQELRGNRVPAQPVPSATPVGAVDQARPSDTLDDWYLAFEDQFRGSREETKRAQEIYLDYVAAAGAGTASAPILDIGCGRGEWLELLMEHGSVARGVDLNQAMVLDNRRRGLDVTERDVIAYLAELPGASLGMVTGFHIIEHLRFDLLVTLFDECRRVLRPGGCILFETPNPENLVVGAYTFYFDPTHRHPLPPQLIEFVVRERGYADVEILRLHPREEAGSDQALLDKWFRGPTDYAVIGWKDHKGPLPR